MHQIKEMAGDTVWIGANDRRLAMFEGVYSVPKGVSYNAYLIRDERTAILDTADAAVGRRFFENVEAALSGRRLDYVIVQHAEPDHSALLGELLARHPEATVVCGKKTLELLKQFFGLGLEGRARAVSEGDELSLGRHNLKFIMAPMVHWPEVMVTYDAATKTLFSADAFGCFGALNGALYADEVDYARDCMDEARRYYTNIVGKYGAQVAALLKKAAAPDIVRICPLHGYVWRENLEAILCKYRLWSAFEPEERGVMIAYASVYGGTENAAELLASELNGRGVRSELFDVSVTDASEIVAAAFKWSHLAFASTTYNMGIFVSMEAVIHDLVAHNIQNRTVAILENGSWAPASGGLIRERLSACKGIEFVEPAIRILSSVTEGDARAIAGLADALAGRIAPPIAAAAPAPRPAAPIDGNATRRLSYGLFLLTARHCGRENGCIVNTVIQVAEKPTKLAVAVNKANLTRDFIEGSGKFCASVLTEGAPYGIFQRFGLQSGRDADKFAEDEGFAVAANGLRYIAQYANAAFGAKVVESIDCGSHTLFVAEVTEAIALSDEPSATYKYYFEHIKPKPAPPKEAKKGFVCRICGYTYEGDALPEGFLCPLCKHGAEDFERL